MTINKLIQTRNVQLVINAADLKELFLEWVKEKDSQIQATKEDQYLSAHETATLLKVTMATLWRWEKVAYLIPVRIGSRRYFRKSDVDKLFREINKVNK